MNLRPAARPVAAILALCTLAACSGAAGPTYAGAIQEGQTAAREVLRQCSTTALGIALVDREQVVWAQSFGLADLDARRAPTDATLFGIASVSKMFAAVAVLQLVERGLVELDAPLVRYVPSFRMADPRFVDVTVRMLLDHSSGLPGTTHRNAEATSPLPGYSGQVLAALAEERLKAPPGHMSVYCNDGFTLIESLVGSVTGKTYVEYVQAEVLAPLGMSRSSYTLAPFPDDAYARSYRSGVALPQEFFGPQASAGLYSTPTEMGAFLRMLLNGGTLERARILLPSSVDAMAVDQTAGSFNPAPSAALAYGLGWDTVTEPGLRAVGIPGWAKSGASAHYGAQVIVAPGEGLGVVVMGTLGAGYDPLAIAQRVLLRALLETGRIPGLPDPLPPVAAPVAPVPDGLLASLAGEYANHTDLYRLRPEEDGSLTLLVFDEGAFVPSMPGLRYRSDGWFTSEARPLDSIRVVEGDGSRYIAQRAAGGDRHYLDQAPFAERVRGDGSPLSPSWSRRAGATWLVVNERSDSLMLAGGVAPWLGLTASPEFAGLLVARFPGSVLQVLDPSRSDDRAEMMLVIPTNNGRDLNDLVIVVKEGEEWVRWGDGMYRPLATVPRLPLGATTPVPIGAEGYAEWRDVEAGFAPRIVSVTGATSWKLYDPGFGLFGSGGTTGRMTVPAGAGTWRLMLFGAPGSPVGVTVE